jgi:excisionase family DNA binding protein
MGGVNPLSERSNMPIHALKTQKMLDVGEISLRLGISTKTVRRLIMAGALHAHRIRRAVRVSEEDLLSYLNSMRE